MVHALSFGSSYIVGTENGVGGKKWKRSPSNSSASALRPSALLISAFPLLHPISFFCFPQSHIIRLSSRRKYTKESSHARKEDTNLLGFRLCIKQSLAWCESSIKVKLFSVMFFSCITRGLHYIYNQTSTGFSSGCYVFKTYLGNSIHHRVIKTIILFNI